MLRTFFWAEARRVEVGVDRQLLSPTRPSKADVLDLLDIWERLNHHLCCRGVWKLWQISLQSKYAMQAELRDSLENTLLDLHHSTRNYGGKNGSPQVGRICSRIWLLLFVFLNITLLVWNLSILTTHKSQSKNTRCAIQSADCKSDLILFVYISNLPHIAPASHTLMPKKILFHKYSHWTSPFSKKPGPIVDAAWHEQLEGGEIRRIPH